MKKSDFYELKIGQKIYYKGKVDTVTALYLNLKNGKANAIELASRGHTTFKNWMHDLSFDPPEKPKRKETFWLWFNVNIGNNPGFRACNEEGIGTDGVSVTSWDVTPSIKWQKIEGSEFEVEVDW